MRDLEDKSFLLLVTGVSLAFAWILWPFSGAIFWGTVLAIVFMPLYRLVLRVNGHRPNIAALGTVTIILLIVILPLIVVGTLVLRQAAVVYRNIETGELDVGHFFRQLPDLLPSWAAGILNHFELRDFGAVQERFSAELAKGGQFIATQAVSIGQNTFDFVVGLFIALYLLFFLLRDGDALAARIGNAVPLRADRRHALFSRFATVIRATVKGSVIVAAVQGALGGLMFWLLGIDAALLWGTVMALLALLPAIGAALVWLPASLYLLATGAVWQGIALIAYGVLVIGTVDNVLRPVLVRNEVKMPDYVVLISTLGGISVFGINGLVIGPVIAALFIAAWDFFTEEQHRTRDNRPAG